MAHSVHNFELDSGRLPEPAADGLAGLAGLVFGMFTDRRRVLDDENGRAAVKVNFRSPVSGFPSPRGRRPGAHRTPRVPMLFDHFRRSGLRPGSAACCASVLPDN